MFKKKERLSSRDYVILFRKCAYCHQTDPDVMITSSLFHSFFPPWYWGWKYIVVKRHTWLGAIIRILTTKGLPICFSWDLYYRKLCSYSEIYFNVDMTCKDLFITLQSNTQIWTGFISAVVLVSRISRPLVSACAQLYIRALSWSPPQQRGNRQA